MALTVYLGWSPIEHDPTTGVVDVKLPFGHVSVGRSAIVHDEPAVALRGGHESVGYDSAMGLEATKLCSVSSVSIAAHASALYAGPG